MAAGDPGTLKRNYSSIAVETTLSASLASAASGDSNTVNVAAITGFPGTAPYTLILDPDTSKEEVITVTVTGSTALTAVRGQDGTAAVAHSAGATVRHGVSGREFKELQTHIAARGYDTDSAILSGVDTHVHGIVSGEGDVVGTAKSQTLTNKTISGSSNTISNINLASQVTGTLPVANGGTGITSLGTGIATFLGTPSSANLRSAVTDETGSGALVFGTSPTIASPTITGTGAIAGTFTGNITGNVTGNADTATTLATSRNFQITGDVEASAVSFNGSGNVSLTSSIATGAIVNADINSAAAIAYSKLNLSGGIVNADINSSAQIAYGKLNLSNSITNADINASAAIDWTKIAPSSTVSSTELGYLDGVTSAIQTQIDSKLSTSTAATTYAPLASPALTGVPTAPTAAANTNTTQIATTAYVQTEINDLIAAAPGALDTLNELAAALGNDASFSTTVTNSLATKLNLSGGTMSGAIAMGTNKITGMGDPTSAQDAATKNYVDTAAIAPSNLTGPITSVGPATAVASQTGTGSTFVMQASPTLTTPDIGVATATSINGTAIPSSKTLVATDSTTYVVPSQTGNSGKYLTTDGTTSSWGVVDALPSQTGNSGKYLTTNGTSASWAAIVTDPTPSIFMLMGA